MERSKVVSIIGMGYVGLPLLIESTKVGWSVFGIDANEERVTRLNQADSYIEDVSNEELRGALESGRVKFSSSSEIVAESDIVIFCLPTPTLNHEPDLSILLDAIKEYAPYFRDGVLIISESSSYPGTLRDKIMPLCEAVRGNKVFHYGHAPERVDPGNKKWTNRKTPRIISVIDSKSMGRMREFYSSICNELIEVKSPEIAEAAKMFENSFRQVNIALVTEFARYCNKVGIPADLVLEAASTKPFGFMKFNYGIGVGGHCIPVDPVFLLDHARSNGANLDIIQLSNEINQEQPRYVFDRMKKVLGQKIAESRVLVVGLSYKPNTSDLRESPSIELLQLIISEGIEVYWYDPMCNQKIEVPSGSPEDRYDIGIVTVIHDGFDYSQILDSCSMILDCTHKIPLAKNVTRL